MSWWQVAIAVVSSLGLGYIIRWYFTERIGLEITHRHRVIEEHTKSLHRYVEQHYMPVCSYAARLAAMLSEVSRTGVKQASTDDLQHSFFRLARWSYAQYNWLKKAGAVLMLRNRVAEIVLAKLSEKIVLAVFGSDELTFRDLHELNQFLDSHEEAYRFLSAFQSKLQSHPLADIYENYLRWLGKKDISQLAQELRCYDELFMYEINKAYQPWYGEEPTKPEVDFHIIAELLRNVEADDAKKYLKRIGAPKELQHKTDMWGC